MSGNLTFCRKFLDFLETILLSEKDVKDFREKHLDWLTQPYISNEGDDYQTLLLKFDVIIEIINDLKLSIEFYKAKDNLKSLKRKREKIYGEQIFYNHYQLDYLLDNIR